VAIVPMQDTLVRGGHVICPASGLDGVMDVLVSAGRIAAIAPDIVPQGRTEVADMRGKLVLPGMIDTHAHVYQYVTGRFGLAADLVGVQSGVTTVVDQGGPSCMTLPGFRHFCAEPAATQVYAFLSASSSAAWRGISTRSCAARTAWTWRQPWPPPAPTQTSCAASRRMPRSAALPAGGSA
jgi:dihydroorotase